MGDKRVVNKLKHYSEPPTGNPVYKEMYDSYLRQIWYKTPVYFDLEAETIYGVPYMHPNSALQKGVKKFVGELPSYINTDQLIRELYE